MDGPTLSEFCVEVNGGAAIGSTLKFQLINMAKAMIEHRRPWMILRRTDTSKTVTTANTWQTGIDLSSITDFSRFYGECPIKLFDGTSNFTEYTQRPFNQRLQYIQTPNTFVYDESAKTLYLNSTVPYAGTLYIDHLIDSPVLTNAADSYWVFPSWSHALLGFFAIGIHKGGIDYDDVNARMSADNRAVAGSIVTALETLDNEKQLSAIQSSDPYGGASGYRSGAINMNA